MHPLFCICLVYKILQFMIGYADLCFAFYLTGKNQNKKSKVISFLYQNTNQAGGAFVDDFREGFTKLLAGVVGHMGELCGHAITKVLV